MLGLGSRHKLLTMRSSNGPLPALVALLGAFVGGCSAPVVDDAQSATGSTTEAIVLVERSAAEGGVVQTNVSAKFMRLTASADPELAERIVGGSWLELPAVGECAAVGAGLAEETPSLATLGSIELLDVGDLSLRTGLTLLPLATRAFPDVGDLVSGVFYTSRDARSDLPAPARYVLESTGSVSIDKFVVEVDAPAAPEAVRVGETLLADGVTLEDSTATTIHWRASEARKNETDLVYVDLVAASGTSMRCTFNDSGEGLIPASAITNKTFGPSPASISLAVHRIRQGSFVASGIDAADLRFDLSVVGHATVVAASP